MHGGLVGWVFGSCTVCTPTSLYTLSLPCIALVSHLPNDAMFASLSHPPRSLFPPSLPLCTPPTLSFPPFLPGSSVPHILPSSLFLSSFSPTPALIHFISSHSLTSLPFVMLFHIPNTSSIPLKKCYSHCFDHEAHTVHSTRPYVPVSIRKTSDR